ncbi:tRNA (adenosine(37)-N6)-threonylcarbamoyltransferase complex dimerization subunit type 1 TsaB [Streptococcus sp. X16XC17]|uniref:tRNA (adenosine(37)-N6)-threonylcarbamoyltransferase complex dimerization subunit type 1 TsaB n=1 Tax=unclassified Streptococcus TaxID=2608887 RepID=UPI00066FECB4|nr:MULTISPECIES: tRNA (adenosine(37)-N6)-threonylcarbamoyltransferase complex dimerization subunit type 1 TsaB [unclassified Streptococcus]TCD45544.1 tRNA (adenosine(37)-N6)-threonylcarbamoyltransferase complex dimerization subunit type 1 TsaB [Streptococcus sp. X16XC17]
MKILSFDTSSQALSVALLEDDKLMAETSLNIKKNHSISLMPTIDFLMAQLTWKPVDLERIVVAQGPGSYTGLRVAVATAKTLAYALQIDLVGISSLLALTDTDAQGVVVPIMDARRNHVYVGFYENGRALEPDRHAAFEEVLEKAAGFDHVTFVGEVAAFEEQIKESCPQATIQATLQSAELIGRLGQSLEPVNVHAFEPSYLKRVEAEENWLKAQGQTAVDDQDYIKRV